MTSRRRALRRSSTTASSTTSASLRSIWTAAAIRSARAATRRSCSHAFAEWGPACLDRFNGMFAFAVWDARERALSCSLATASGSSRSTTRRSTVALALRLGGQGAARGRLPRAACRSAGARASTSRSRTSSPTRRSSTASGCCRPVTPSIVAERGHRTDTPLLGPRVRAGRVRSRRGLGRGASRGAFERAVTRQLVSDVPIGSYLSGGIDSASIAAVATRSIPRLMTFTGGFDLSSVTGTRARLRRARRCGGDRATLPDRALRDGDARRRHGVGDARARLAPRGSPGRDVRTRTTTSRGSPRSS